MGVDWALVSLVANVVVASAYFGITGAILIPLLQSRQLRTNRLGAATAAIFFSCAVGHGMHAVHTLTALAGNEPTPSVIGWHTASWDVTSAVIGVYYWTLRRTYGSLMRGATLFEDMREAQRVAALEAEKAVTDARRAAEAERDAHAAMLREVIANNQSLIYVKDLEGRYLLANQAFENAMNVAEIDILGRTDEAIDPECAPAWQAADRRARDGAHTLEEYGTGPDGRRIYESTKFPLYDANGELYATCGISLDVTEERRAAKAMADARDAALAAAAAKSAFLATMSHEIRTPMNAVVGMTGLLLDTALDPVQRDYAETVRSSGDALLDIINDILDYSKIEAGELQIEENSFDLLEAVESALDLVTPAAAAKNLDLVSSVDPAAPSRVVGDVTRFRQVLVNLLSNAVKFTPAGEVLVTVRCTGDSDGDDLTLGVSVADTGIGIPADAIGRLFNPFHQVDASTTRVYGGTGLGLAICRRLVEAMHGQLSVTSEPGKGSEFRFTVRVRACTAPVEAPYVSHLHTLAGTRMLIVDDNATNRRVLRLQLENWGVTCVEADGAGAALELGATAGPWDAALLDFNMPDLDGGMLAAELKKLPATADVPLILLTSYGNKLSPAEQVLFRESMFKPVKVLALRETLERALGVARPLLPEPRSGDADLPVTSGLRILYVEDNLTNQKVGRLMLRTLGLTAVDTVGNGQEAVAAVAARPYDLVLMDVQMPVMDGLEATRRIRSELPADRQPCIVAMTASAMLSDREACLAAGMDGYLAKPVREKEMRAVLSGITLTGRPEPQETDSPDGAALDAAVLRALAAQVGISEAELGQVFLATYLSDADERIGELRLAIAVDDAATALRIAHALRSASASLGANRLARLLADLERAAGARDVRPDLERLGGAVLDEYDRVADEIRARLAADVRT
jgi:signal transduction histidine kinase/DNA-binding response OmpR family regulator